MKSARAYSVAAGMLPPNTSRTPFSVMVSTTILMSPERSSSVITGSTPEMASICPLRIAATAVGPVPTPITETSSGFSPTEASR